MLVRISLEFGNHYLWWLYPLKTKYLLEDWKDRRLPIGSDNYRGRLVEVVSNLADTHKRPENPLADLPYRSAIHHLLSRLAEARIHLHDTETDYLEIGGLRYPHPKLRRAPEPVPHSSPCFTKDRILEIRTDRLLSHTLTCESCAAMLRKDT